MEYNLKKTPLPVLTPVLDTVSEQSVDVDITLPDYCPDVQRVLRCTMCPMIYSTSRSGGQLTVDGGVLLRVMYTDSVRSNIRSYEHTVPFSAGFAMRDVTDEVVVCTDTKVEYLNCRVHSPRKLSLHGAFSLYVTASCRGEVRFAYDGGRDDLQLLTESTSLCALSCLCSDSFSYAEDISLNDNPPIEAMISHSLSVRLTELRAVSGKIHLSAEGQLRLMYLSDLEQGSVEHLSYVFPISRVVDCDGVTDDTVLRAQLCLMSYDLRRNTDALSEGTLLSLDMRLCFSAFGYEEQAVTMIADAFSTSCDVSCTVDTASCIADLRVDTYSHVERGTVSTGDDSIASVMDLYADGVTVTPSISNGKLILSTKVSVCMLLLNTDDQPVYLDRAINFDYETDSGGLSEVVAVDASADSVSYRIVDEHTIELRADVRYTVCLCEPVTLSAVNAVTALEDTATIRDDSALTLCYAQPGERVWDIAKRYAARPDMLKAENGIDGDRVENAMMLLIPT